MYEEDFNEQVMVKKSKKSIRARKRPIPNIIKAETKRIGFKAWFTNKLDLDKRLKAHHFDQIRLFMLGLGLTSYEPINRYENGLKAYFGE